MLFSTFSRWVGIKEFGRPKPALLDSGRPRTGLLSSGIVICKHNWRNRQKRDLDAKFESVFDYQPFAHKNLQFHVFVHVIYVGTSVTVVVFVEAMFCNSLLFPFSFLAFGFCQS